MNRCAELNGQRGRSGELGLRHGYLSIFDESQKAVGFGAAHGHIPIGGVVLHHLFMLDRRCRDVLLQAVRVDELLDDVTVLHVMEVLAVAGDGHLHRFVFAFDHQDRSGLAHLDAMLDHDAFEDGFLVGSVACLDLDFLARLEVGLVADLEGLFGWFSIRQHNCRQRDAIDFLQNRDREHVIGFRQLGTFGQYCECRYRFRLIRRNDAFVGHRLVRCRFGEGRKKQFIPDVQFAEVD